VQNHAPKLLLWKRKHYFRWVIKEKFPPAFSGVQTCEISTHQGHDKKKKGDLGEKNQTNAGRVSQYTSLLQRNVFCIISGYKQPGNKKNYSLVPNRIPAVRHSIKHTIRLALALAVVSNMPCISDLRIEA